MSEPMNALELENQKLREQVANNSKVFENLLAQLEAHKAMINDCLQNIMNLKTSNILLSNNYNKLNAELEALKNPVPAPQVEPIPDAT